MTQQANPTTVLSHAQEAAHAFLMARIEDHEEDGHRIPCRGPEGHLWLATNRTHQDRAAEACTWCPVTTQCAAYAEQRAELAGVWGGMSPGSRAAYRRQTHRAAA